MNKENNNMIYRNADDDVNRSRFECFRGDFSSPIDHTVMRSGAMMTDSGGGGDDVDFFVEMVNRELARRLSIRELAINIVGDHHKLYASPETFENGTWDVSGSPQSILGGVGSLSGRIATSVPSNWRAKDHAHVGFPYKTQLSKEKECLELLYAAERRRERFKPYSDSQFLVGVSRNSLQVVPDQPVQNLSHMVCASKPRDFVLRNQIQLQIMNQPPRSYYREEMRSQQLRQIHERQQIQNQLMSSVGSQNLRCSGQPSKIPQSSRVPLQLLSGSNVGMKRECNGTGVFLPRPYNKYVGPRQHKSGSAALQLSRAVSEQNLHANSKPPSHFHGGFLPNQDVLIANEGNVISSQQIKTLNPAPVPSAQAISLPQEWTY